MNVVNIDRFGNTPLIGACIDNDIDEAREIIDSFDHHSNSAVRNARRINPGQVNNEGKTALIYACEHHNNDLALLVLRTKLSNPDHETPDGKTALSIAQESQEMQEFIIEIISGDYVEIKELDDFEFIDAELSLENDDFLNDLSVQHCRFTDFTPLKI